MIVAVSDKFGRIFHARRIDDRPLKSTIPEPGKTLTVKYMGKKLFTTTKVCDILLITSDM